MFPSSGNGLGPGGREGLFRSLCINRLTAVMTTKETGSTANIMKWSTEGTIMVGRGSRVNYPNNGMLFITANAQFIYH